MKYHVEEIKHSAYSSTYKVLDENGAQRGETLYTEIQAQWMCEDLNAGKKLASELTEEEVMDFTNNILGEVEERRETGTTAPVEEKVIPVREDRDEMTISGQNEAGTIIDYRGEAWLVTHSYEVTGNEYTHPEDEDQPAGWYSELFRVRNNTKAMEVIAEQYTAGQARFISGCFVKFADEEYTNDMRNLAYSPEIGLYDKTRI